MVSALALSGQIRAFACRTTEVVREAQRIHQMSPVAAVALGRLLTGVLLMAEQGLKNETDTLTAIVRGDGPLQGLTVVGTGQATVRGYCHQPVVETVNRRPGKLDIGQAVGKGTLTIIKDLGLKEPYIGKVELVSGEIAEDITYYLASSEQIPTATGLGVLVEASGIKQAGGFMIQPMPDATEETIQYLEQRLQNMPEITNWLQQGLSPEQILREIFCDPRIEFFTPHPVAYACPCSRERMERNLIALGARDLAELAADPAGVNLECHFCARHYYFTPQEIAALLLEVT
jgi:molecular chaperone Hsp33